jgi:hypothetical protein
MVPPILAAKTLRAGKAAPSNGRILAIDTLALIGPLSPGGQFFKVGIPFKPLIAVANFAFWTLAHGGASC